jgi:hypothetical protein
LRQRGIDVLTAFEDGRAELDDDELLDRALFLNRVFVSQDHDLLRLGRRRQKSGTEFFGIAYVEQEGINIGRVIEYLELVARLMSPEEMRNHVEHVPRY